MASALIEAEHLTWKGAELTAAIASSDGWANATGNRGDCVYRREALRLATDMQAALNKIIGLLTDDEAESA